MIPCPNCSQPLAADAKRCPACGGRTQWGRRQDRLGLLLFFLVVAAALVGLAAWSYHHNDKVAKQRACEEISQITPEDCGNS